MNEIEFAKSLRNCYDSELKRDDDFLNIVGKISEYDGLDYNKIKDECKKLKLTFMTSLEASKLASTKESKAMYETEKDNYIFFDESDSDKGIG